MASLSPELLERFERDGFFVMARVVPAELLAALLDELHAIKGEAEASGGETTGWDANASGAAQDRCTFAFSRDKDGALREIVKRASTSSSASM